MWLQRYINRIKQSSLRLVPLAHPGAAGHKAFLAKKPLLLLLSILVAAGCASSGPKPAEPTPSEVPGEQVLPEIPPQAMTMFEQAVAVMASGDFVDAELRLKEFLLQYPAYPGAHVNLAIIHSQNGNDEAAQAAIDAALALDADHAPALNQQGMLLRRNGKFLEAEAAYLKAVTASPDYALAHYNLGVLNELYLQRLDVALQHFEKYQELVGSDKQVEKWIADLRRRVTATQRTANVAE
jgi:tetratricopeptide (TPR) repeat protein